MNVLPIGGKSPSETVVGFSADANGNLITKKKWDNNIELIYEMDSTPSGTSTIWLTPVDISDCGAVSIRISNTLDVDVKLYIASDLPDDGTAHYALKDINGDDYLLTIPANKSRIVISPDDVPVLQWLNSLNLAVKPSSTPTTGIVKIWLARKR